MHYYRYQRLGDVVVGCWIGVMAFVVGDKKYYYRSFVRYWCVTAAATPAAVGRGKGVPGELHLVQTIKDDHDDSLRFNSKGSM